MSKRIIFLIFGVMLSTGIFVYSPQPVFASVSCNYHDFGNQGPSPYIYTMRGVNAVTVGEHQSVGSVTFFISVDGGAQENIGTRQVIGAGTDGFNYNVTVTNDTDKKKKFAITLYCQHSDGTIATTVHYAYAEAVESEPVPEPEPTPVPEPEPAPEPELISEPEPQPDAAPAPETPAEQPETTDQQPAETPKVVPVPAPEAGLQQEPAIDPSTAFTMARVQGEVEYREGRGPWVTVAAGDHIPPNALIRTKDGMATIQFTDGSTLDIGRNTELNLDLSTPPGESFFETLVGLSAGQIRAKVKNVGEKFFRRRVPMRIRTSRAVAAVKGTELVVVHDLAKNISTIYLKEGTIDVTPTATGEVSLSFAQVKITVDESGNVESVFLPSVEWNALIADEFVFEEVGEAEEADAGRNVALILYLLLPPLFVAVGAGAYWAFKRRRKV